MFYVYEAKIEDEIIYIGKGSGNRYQHCYRKWKNCSVSILEYFENSEKAFEKEKELIKKYGRKDLGTGTLLNKSNGGKYIKGAIPWKNKKLSEEHKEKIRSTYISKNYKPTTLYGIDNGMFGKKHSLETKSKMSQKKKGAISNFKGKTHSDISKEKNRISHLGKISKKKIKFDKDLVKKLKYNDKLTNKELAKYFDCSLFPIKNILKEIKRNY